MISMDASGERRADELFAADLQVVHRRTDRMFAFLLCLQWLGFVAAACWISPRTWIGAAVHVHVWAAVLLGGALAGLPLFLSWRRSGDALTRHTIAVAQMLFSALLIHLLGGRIEAHFHVFGSLALLAAYRDWRVLTTATVVVAADHLLRGVYWPESVFGVLVASPWRAVEHAGWVVFENVFLCVTVRSSICEMRNLARQRALLETTNRRTEEIVQQRTAELQQAKNRMQMIIECVPNGIIIADQDDVIRMVNPQLETMFGYEPGELISQKVEILLPERFRARHLSLRDRFMQEPSSRAIGRRLDLHGVDKHGREFPVELGLNLQHTDEGLLVLAAVVDITTRKRSERERQEYAARLRQTNQELTIAQAELEQKNQELDEFTYVASHDLQEPVRKLVSFSELLKEDAGEDLNEQALKDLEFIGSAASRMRQLIQDLLALSRTGRAAMRMEEVALDDCRQDALDTLELRIKETDALIQGDSLPTVIGDRTMLTQLFQNLIGNALKFVTDRRPEINFTVEDYGDSWGIGVRDNGIGIKAEHADRIFKPFQRLHRRDQFEGTGIGLSICRKTVERHNGKLWVESVPGKGSHFRFTIPKQAEVSASAEDAHQTELLSCPS